MDSGHPGFDALWAIDVVHVVNQDDHVGAFYLGVRVLLVVLAAAAVNELREHVVGEEIVGGRDRDWMVGLLDLSRKCVRNKRDNDACLAYSL